MERTSSEPDARILATLLQTKQIAIVIGAAIPALILALWFIPGLAALAPPIWSKMVANAAVGMLIAAGSLALSEERRSALSVRLSQIAALAVLALGALTVTEYAAHISLGIDTWLPHARSGDYPGRPSPQTGLGFVVLGLSLLTVRETKNAGSLFADISAVVLLTFVLVMFGGYVYGARAVNGITSMTLMSPQTFACFSIAAFVVVGRRARLGTVLADLVGVGIGSQIVRMVLPAVILVPFAFFFLVQRLIETETMTEAMTRALAAPAETLIFLGIIVWMAWRINAMERRLRDLSVTDELTKVYNRRGFHLLAQQVFRDEVRAGTGMTMLFFDLDGLKRANDTIGHVAGSKLIQELASILVESFRESDLVGRVGGDEFTVLTTHDGGRARDVLARVAERVSAYNKSSPSPVPLSYSVGVAEFSHGSTESLDSLLARADGLMYQHKAARKISAASRAA